MVATVTLRGSLLGEGGRAEGDFHGVVKGLWIYDGVEEGA